MFKVFTVGWDPAFAHSFLAPIAARTGIEFEHGLVGDCRRVPIVSKAHPDIRWIALSKAADEPLPIPDYRLLASLESVGVPTVRAMVAGDLVLRHRRPAEALSYVTLLARQLIAAVGESKPDVVLGSFDSAHSALALAVAKSQGIPWVALAFSVIPDNLTGFCRGVTPETLLPIVRPIDDPLRHEAREVLNRYRSKSVRIMAYRPPESIIERAHQLLARARNLAGRVSSGKGLGVDRFTYPTINERLTDIGRRTLNRIRLPADRMLRRPPEAPFVFFPLHMAPESSVDTWAPMYQNQLELAVQLSLAVPADIEVVVKLHFSDPDNYSPGQLRRLMQLPRVRIAHPGASSRSFIEQAALVVGIQGTANLEAALLGKPVLLFGDSPYQHFPRTERAKRPDELNEQIRRMLDLPPPDDEEILEAFAAYTARYMPGRINDWKLPMQEEEFDRLADCFRALRSYVELPVNRDTWYNQAPFSGTEQRTLPCFSMSEADQA
jgi:hypothetical protein